MRLSIKGYSMFCLLFLLPLLSGVLLFSFWFEKRKRFGIRVSVSLLGLLLLSAAVNGYYYILGQTVYGITAVYTTMIAAAILAIYFCFKERIETVLFSGCAGYAVQNLTSRLIAIVRLMNGLPNWAFYSWQYIFIQTAVFAAVYTIIYFLLVKRINRNASGLMKNKKILLLSALTLLITIVFSGFIDINESDSSILAIIASFFSVFGCSLILLIQSGILERSELKIELEIVQNLLHKEKDQYELSKETIDIINIKCHDLKHQIKFLRKQDGGISAEALKEIEDAVAIYDSTIKTGNEALDVLLTEKSLQCENKGIKFSCMADGSRLGFIAPADLYSLFGNAIENAMEAVLKINDKDKRVISFVVKADKGLLFIQVNNYYCDKLELEDGLPLSTKQDKRYHGFGMKSMQLLAAKYGGYLSISGEEGIFKLNIVLPLEQ